MAYTPGINGGRINVTLGGNTAGVGALASTGTVTLAGGNNITLSQAGNAITISGAAGGGAAGTHTLGMSNIGNSSGISGVITGTALQYAFAGGNNVTLSQSINGSSGTITVSAASQTVQTQNRHNLTLSGNTAGAMAQVSSGTLTLAGGNNITLSQNGNAVTISGPTIAAQTTQTQNLHNITLAGNTAGVMAQVSSGTLTLAGGNNITLSQNGNAVTVSGPNTVAQTNQTVGLYAASNTTQSSLATVDARSMTFAGAGIASVGATNGSVVISVPSGGGAGFSAGMSNIGNTSGTSGVVSNQLVLAGGNNITLSQSTGAGGATVTISGAAGGGGGGITLSRYQNMDRGTTAVMAFPYNTLFIQRLNQENDMFAGNMTVNTVLLNISGSASSGASSTQTLAARTLSVSMGLYTPVATANTVLTLINSGSTTWGTNTTHSAYPYTFGNRWISMHSSQWSSSPQLSEGGDYVFAMLVRSSGTSTAMSFIGQSYMNSQQRSGYFGVSTTTGNITMPHGNFWNAMYTASTSAFPSAISANQVNRNNATAIFIPHVILNNQYTY